jgi:hypothetical protein
MKGRIIAACIAACVLLPLIALGCGGGGTNTAKTTAKTTVKTTAATAPATPCASTTAVWATPAGAGIPPTPADLTKQNFKGPDIPRITAQTLKQMLDAGTPLVLIDSRMRDLFDMGHIKGAKNIPNDDKTARDAKFKLFCPNDLIVFYCD